MCEERCQALVQLGQAKAPLVCNLVKLEGLHGHVTADLGKHQAGQGFQGGRDSFIVSRNDRL